MDDSVRLRKKLDKLKSEINLKEGEMNALASRLSDDFGIKSVAEGYSKFDSISSAIEELEHKRAELLREAKARLARFDDNE